MPLDGLGCDAALAGGPLGAVGDDAAGETGSVRVSAAAKIGVRSVNDFDVSVACSVDAGFGCIVLPASLAASAMSRLAPR